MGDRYPLGPRDSDLFYGLLMGPREIVGRNHRPNDSVKLARDCAGAIMTQIEVFKEAQARKTPSRTRVASYSTVLLLYETN